MQARHGEAVAKLSAAPKRRREQKHIKQSSNRVRAPSSPTATLTSHAEASIAALPVSVGPEAEVVLRAAQEDHLAERQRHPEVRAAQGTRTLLQEPLPGACVMEGVPAYCANDELVVIEGVEANRTLGIDVFRARGAGPQLGEGHGADDARQHVPQGALLGLAAGVLDVLREVGDPLVGRRPGADRVEDVFAGTQGGPDAVPPLAGRWAQRDPRIAARHEARGTVRQPEIQAAVPGLHVATCPAAGRAGVGRGPAHPPVRDVHAPAPPPERCGEPGGAEAL
eukprot:CAMPEP_0198502928 /NCGR_PEP_ID=MMETSP1462-20131121/9604_1 /TAXON_ID=1333877 /ORGANISM="Brandtodinium nutriculum, Strain RCC3387" /LENGTH=280 /DNA_ID=CAMNT_0044232033 /DNA_START=343 /DNA_END=1182 /DNA_ORIENTATION=+